MMLLKRIGQVCGIAFYVAMPLVGNAETPTPVPGLPTACGVGICAGGPTELALPGVATYHTVPIVNGAGQVIGQQGQINQVADRAVLNWSEFNVAAGNKVNFSQPGANALAINQIYQGSPSQILGNVTADGQIYLINRNGILFGRDSQVNVGSLVASSLELTPQALANGIASSSLVQPNNVTAAFAAATDASGAPIPGKVVVEQGAKITSAAGGNGRVALLGQQVENAGTIESPSGQVILAAGQKVYLQASEDPKLRGLLVEVDAGGKAWNQATGQIRSTLGNVTLVGLAVNQDGRVSATTSVQANGSVRLLARDSVNPTPATAVLQARAAGAVEFGGGSVTEVVPDEATAARTAVDDQAQLTSRVEAVGRTVDFRAGSLVRVPGGEVSVRAVPNFVDQAAGNTPLPADPGSRIRLEAGATVDVSGSEAEADITRNVVRVELRKNELRDAPLQRDGQIPLPSPLPKDPLTGRELEPKGPLRDQAIFVDVREGTPLADVSGAIATLPRDVYERTGKGGTVSLVSRGDVVLNEGATVDVSGGGINYRGGVIKTSQLVTPDGRRVDIARASPDQVYREVLNPTVEKRYPKFGVVEQRQRAGFGRFEAGYREGLDAGTVQIAAPSLIVNGTLLGRADAGVRQRTPATRPEGGRLVIGLPDGQGLNQPDFRAPSIRFGDTLVPGQVLAGEAFPAGRETLDLSTEYLRGGGFTRTEAYSNGVISFADTATLDLRPESVFRLTGSEVRLTRSIRAPGGVIDATAVTVNADVRIGTGRPGVTVADGVTLDASGRWVNDTLAVAGANPADPVALDGGRVLLAVSAEGGEMRIGDGVTLRADAGGWLDASSRLQTGRGGDLLIVNGQPRFEDDGAPKFDLNDNLEFEAVGVNVALVTLGRLDLSAWGIEGQGGTLTVGAERVLVAAAGPTLGEPQRADPLAGNDPYVLGPGFFANGSFRTYRVSASGTRTAGGEPLEIASGTTLAPRQQRRRLAPDFAALPTGTDIREVTFPYLPPTDVREAADLAFAYLPHEQVTPATAGDLRFADGAVLDLDAGGRVAFSAPTRIRLDGRIRAPGGAVMARLTTPGEVLDQGFDPDAGIFVGATARLDLSGTTILRPNDLGLRQGEVLDGGRVNMTAERGRVELAAGAELDVSGANAMLDLPGATGGSSLVTVRPAEVASRGGSIELRAPEGIRLDATLRAAGGSVAAEGGRLSLGVSRNSIFGFDPPDDPPEPFPALPREIVVGSGVAPDNGRGVLDPALLNGSGFDSLRLQADDAIRFAGPVALALRNRLTMEAPDIIAPAAGGTVALNANAIAIGSRVRGGRLAGAAAGGPATLDVHAGVIDLFASVALQGFSVTNLTARTDIRATGAPTGSGASATLQGSLAAAGELNLTAAQVYPTTFSDYRIDVAPVAGTGILRVLPGVEAPTPVLSAGGRLRLAADQIEQRGVLKAPLGQLELNAGSRLELAAGSVTSTTGVGQVLPFGRVSAGNWIYEALPGTFARVTTPREKRIGLNAADVTVAAGATVDLRGGGDLYAYEFLPGPGGSVDALAPGANPNLFAILPGGTGAFGTFDTQEYQGSVLQPGDTVRLAGVPGVLAAGEYALLPARYALLPGAVLVEALPTVRDVVMGEARRLGDGTPIVAGVRAVSGAGLADSRTTGFAIRPGSFARQLAEYRDVTGNAFFAASAAAADLVTPPLARDAGALQIGVGTRLTLDGELKLDPDQGDPTKPGDDGKAGLVDLSAERLRVVTTAGSAPAGVVEVTAETIERVGSGSVLLGGSRRTRNDGLEVTAAARTVEVADGVSVGAGELLLVAREQVSVGANATVRATGSASGGAGGVLRIAGSEGSGVLRVSRTGQVELQRAPGVATGDVLVGDGALLAAVGSILVDAGGTARSFGGYEIGGGALAFGSRRIVLGASADSVTDGLAFDGAKLAQISGAAELRLRASQGVDVASDAELGTAALRPARLVLDTPVVAGNGDSLTLRAGEAVLRNTSGTTGPGPASGTGTFTLAAERVRFGGGDLALGGFAAVNVAAANGITASGDAALRSSGDLVLETPFLAGDPGSDLALTAAGVATLRAPATGATPTTSAPVGAALTVAASRIAADTALLYPAGRVRLVADGDVDLGQSATVDVSGRRLLLAGEPVDVAGGDVEVVARTGAARFASGSRVDVSTGSGTAGAGSIEALAAGVAEFAGTLLGSGTAAERSGRLAVTAAGVGALDPLAAKLGDGGFRRSIAIETTAGNLALGENAGLQARDVTVAASGGRLEVAGRIDASGERAGRVILAARDDLVLAAGSEIDARGTGSGSAGGEVTLASASGDLRLSAGSRVRLDGGAGGAGGDLLLRAAATSDDARLAELAGSIEGAARSILEAVLVRTADFIDGAAQDGFRGELDAYMAAAPGVIRTRLSAAADDLKIRPGLEVRSKVDPMDPPGIKRDIDVTDAWDFATWRWDNEPGYLTLRADGNVSVDAGLSDGFVGTGSTLNQQTGDSWTYRVAAGADRSSALPLAVQGRQLDARDTGNLTIGDGVIVRTGTGDIRLVAAGDLVLAGGNTAVYTAGVAARAPGSFGGIRANWSRNGGDIELMAGRDVQAVLPGQLFTPWTVRVNPGGAGRAQWAVDYSRFAQGVAALAGGRVDVRAGRDVSNLAAAVVTTSGDTQNPSGTFAVWGGGDLAVTAKRDVVGGTWSTWLGDLTLRAGRDIAAGSTADFSPLAPTLVTGNGQAVLAARRALEVGAFVNPTVIAPANTGSAARSIYFYNYQPTDALTLTALGGDLRIQNDLLALDALVPGISSDPNFGVLPPTLRARAVSANLEAINSLRLLPGARAQLELIAGRSVLAPNGAVVVMSDARPDAVPGVTNPIESANAAAAPFAASARGAIHVGDEQPVLIVAAAGDVSGGGYDLAKHVRIAAGRDVRDLFLSAQNTSARQISRIEAGRDLRLGTTTTTDGIALGGSGRLQVLAGRNIELGFSRGITTIGRNSNPQLPVGDGAALDIWAGLGGTPDYAGFNEQYWQQQYAAELTRYTQGDGDLPGLIEYVGEVTGSDDLTADTVWAAWRDLEADDRRAYLDQLQPEDQVSFASFVDLVGALVDYTNLVTGRNDLAATTAVDEYLLLPIESQRPLVQEFFFRELRDSGREANLSRERFGFERGRAVVDALFPESVPLAGDLSLLFSRIYTLAGGDINLLVPGGLLSVGLAVPPADQAIQRKPSELGIVAQGRGRVLVYTQGDVLVNQSRIFTLQGGDIVIWSDRGNIDAGRGSKSAVSAPPPVVRVDDSGNVTVEFADAIAGSGIRGILTREDIEPGDVDLVAPEGEVNAGDAGIGSAGNINIAAPIVIGTDNIQVGGVATGVPTDTGSLAGLSGVSGLSNAVAQGAQESATGGTRDDEGSLADAALALLDVLIEGYGDGTDSTCDPQKDPDCRR